MGEKSSLIEDLDGEDKKECSIKILPKLETKEQLLKKFSMNNLHGPTSNVMLEPNDIVKRSSGIPAGTGTYNRYIFIIMIFICIAYDAYIQKAYINKYIYIYIYI